MEGRVRGGLAPEARHVYRSRKQKMAEAPDERHVSQSGAGTCRPYGACVICHGTILQTWRAYGAQPLPRSTLTVLYRQEVGQMCRVFWVFVRETRLPLFPPLRGWAIPKNSEVDERWQPLVVATGFQYWIGIPPSVVKGKKGGHGFASLSGGKSR
jgi:hypothetical protein